MRSLLRMTPSMRTAAVSGLLRRLPALLGGQFGARAPPPLRVFRCSQTTAAEEGAGCFAVKSSVDPQTNSSRSPQHSRVMPANVEIKAKVSDATRLAERAAELSQSEGSVIRQRDTFFICNRGRLKLRDFMSDSGQLIFYERPDTDGPKLSRYEISSTQDPQSLRAVLSEALGVKGEVRKQRRLFLIGQTRVHLDTVEGLGDYMELEVVMRPDQTVEEGQQIAEDLMEKLGVSKESLVTGAYMDLILKTEN